MAGGALIESGSLSLRVDEEGDAIKITALGELDHATIGVLDGQLTEAEASSARRIVLDLGGLDFIDSSGLTVLVTAARRWPADSDRFTVAPGTGQPVRLLRLTGVDRVLKLV